MKRRLLPYEYQLIKELGISEAEYLEFAKAQFDYTRTPEDKLATPQNWETAAIVLTIVGVLFQVAAALLAPKPELPSQQNQRRRRDQTFAPRFGFNSAQDLAKYGDPVNLIYCNTNQNSTGGVRVATSLVWSAIQSFGSSQFMQMLAVIGASNIDPEGIDFNRTAFGQLPIRQFNSRGNWLYLRQGGIMRFSDLRRGVGTDPTSDGNATSDFTYKATLVGTQRAEGFSQAFSPSTAIRCGVFSPIPINVNFIDRNETGQSVSVDLGIEMENRGIYWPDARQNDSRVIVPKGQRFTLRFRSLTSSGASDVRQAASELRRTLASTIDIASIYKIGSLHLRVVGPVSDLELDNDAIDIPFECVQPGVFPEEDYKTANYKRNEVEAEKEIAKLKRQIAELEALLANSLPVLKPGVDEKAVAAKIAEIEGVIAEIEDLRDKRWTTEEINTIASDTGEVFDPVVIEFAKKVDAARGRRDELEALITEEVQKPSGERNKTKLSEWRSEIKSINQRLKILQGKLDEAIRQYGYDTVKGKNLREQRKNLLRKQSRLQRELDALYADANNIDTAATEARNKAWREEIIAKTAEIKIQEDVLKNPESLNNFFNTKCLVKIEEAAYETITPCRIVDFALKARVFKRVAGRTKDYGEVTMDNYKDSDNGVKLRSMFFWVWYRRSTDPEQPWIRVPYIFVIRRGADVDNYISLKFIASDNIGKWQFKFEPIADTAAEMRYHGFSDFAYIENSGRDRQITGPAGGIFTFKGKLRTRDGYLAPINRNPSEIDEWSLFSMRSDTQLTFSFDNGPELEIKAVTEQSVEPFTNYPSLYDNLVMLGFNVYSGQGVQDLRSMSVFVNRGRLVRQLYDDGTYSSTPNTSTSYAPEVFLDTILDPIDGIGQYTKISGIDLVALARAKRFCQRYNLFFDGVIAEPASWRQFWAETAPFSLLELGRIGGKETLIPAVPIDDAGNINRTVKITAMFTAGNILEDSYKEEFIDYGSSVQDLIATVIYRSTELQGIFPRNASVVVNLRDVTEATAIRQTFDLSQFVTNRDQAIMYAKLLCQQRRHLRRNIEFRTFPTDSPLSPGAYIYVDVGQQEWQNIYSGQVEDSGALNIPLTQNVPNGTYNVLLYRSGQGVISTSAAVSNNVASSLAGYTGWLFVLGTAVKTKRVFRVVEVQMDEEGEVSVRATEHPCDTNGQSLIADFSDALFMVR